MFWIDQKLWNLCRTVYNFLSKSIEDIVDAPRETQFIEYLDFPSLKNGLN